MHQLLFITQVLSSIHINRFNLNPFRLLPIILSPTQIYYRVPNTPLLTGSSKYCFAKLLWLV